MRHFLYSALMMPRSPLALTRGVPVRTATAALITGARLAQRGLTLQPPTRSGAVHLAVITLAANADPLLAAPAAIAPESLLLLHRAIPHTAGVDNAVRCVHKTQADVAHTGTAPRARGRPSNLFRAFVFFPPRITNMARTAPPHARQPRTLFDSQENQSDYAGSGCRLTMPDSF